MVIDPGRKRQVNPRHAIGENNPGLTGPIHIIRIKEVHFFLINSNGQAAQSASPIRKTKRPYRKEITGIESREKIRACLDGNANTRDITLRGRRSPSSE